MIKKLIDVNTNINISSVENGFIGANFYTEDDGSAYIRITIKNNNEVLDFTKTDMLPRLDLFCSDGSIFTNEPIDIVYPEKGVIQYKVTDNVIQHAGKMDAKLFLGNKDDSVHVANFYFTISDSGMTGPIGKEVHVDSLKDLVEQVMRQNALGLLDDKFLSKLQDDLKTYVHDNNDLFKGVAGEKGEKGEKGDTGDTGPQGLQGPKGDTGSVNITDSGWLPLTLVNGATKFDYAGVMIPSYRILIINNTKIVQVYGMFSGLKSNTVFANIPSNIVPTQQLQLKALDRIGTNTCMFNINTNGTLAVQGSATDASAYIIDANWIV